MLKLRVIVLLGSVVSLLAEGVAPAQSVPDAPTDFACEAFGCPGNREPARPARPARRTSPRPVPARAVRWFARCSRNATTCRALGPFDSLEACQQARATQTAVGGETDPCVAEGTQQRTQTSAEKNPMLMTVRGGAMSGRTRGAEKFGPPRLNPQFETVFRDWHAYAATRTFDSAIRELPSTDVLVVPSVGAQTPRPSTSEAPDLGRALSDLRGPRVPALPPSLPAVSGLDANRPAFAETRLFRVLAERMESLLRKYGNRGALRRKARSEATSTIEDGVESTFTTLGHPGAYRIYKYETQLVDDVFDFLDHAMKGDVGAALLKRDQILSLRYHLEKLAGWLGK